MKQGKSNLFDEKDNIDPEDLKKVIEKTEEFIETFKWRLGSLA